MAGRTPEPTGRPALTGEALLAHLENEHGEAVPPEHAERVHAAMHATRHAPGGHFHWGGRVLRLWDGGGIEQVDTRERT